MHGTYFGIYLYSVDTHHGNLLKSFATMSRVTFFILHGHMRNCVAQTNTVKKQGEHMGENEGRN